MRDKNKTKQNKKKGSAMTDQSTTSITGEKKRRNKKKKKVGEKKRWRFCFGLTHSFIFFKSIFIFISFKYNFGTWVHLACGLLLFFLRKSWWFVFNKDGDFVLV